MCMWNVDGWCILCELGCIFEDKWERCPDYEKGGNDDG